MADFLIKHLREKGEEHSTLKLLVSQWDFDQKLIPKALQNIGNLFPHYSRHDESHSKQILVNIERLLGKENIAKLTTSDTWLLLEAAYWHDIGMVVPQKDLADAFSNPDFQRYVEQIRNSTNHELNTFCLSFISNDITQCFNGADSPLDAVDKFRQLMAEWFRRQHAERANEIIQDPWERIGITSPRTELIPARLFKLLGRICHSHGLPFENIISPNGLPYREAGLAQEDCHPRFIACLLRMGDLLDLDDNRFCPVMQRIAGDNRPLISKAHEEKHAAIRRLRIDRERIEITAECESIDGYLETFKWFDWLKQEIKNQMTHWQDIVPSREFGLLPTLGNIEVRLGGGQLILKEGQRPQFSVNGKQTVSLLQGSNLYSSKFICIRELLQNAVDATLLQLWLTKESSNEDDWKSPFSEHAVKILQESLVEIKLVETPNEDTNWKLTIVDSGTGISIDDLSYMLNIGGSQENIFRQEKINEMPEWMKPSGAFGIGFQSVFLISDIVKLTTKSIFTNDILEITMYNPLSDKEGLVIVKQLESDISRLCGTTVDINFSLENVPGEFFHKFAGRRSLASQFLREYDPVLDNTLPVQAGELTDQVQQFSYYSLVPIKNKLVTDETNKNVTIESENNLHNRSRKWHFIETDNHQLLIKYQPVRASHGSNTLYRGQPFDQKCLNFAFVKLEIDLLSGKAGNWLTANRDRLKSSADKKLIDLILTALEKIVREDIKNLTPETKPVYSLFLEGMALEYGETWTNLANKITSSWHQLIAQNNLNYSELLKRDEWIFSEYSIKYSSLEEDCDVYFDLDQRESRLEKYIVLNEWFKKDGRTIQILESKKYQSMANLQLRYQLKSEPQPLYSEEALASKLLKSSGESYENLRFLLQFNNNDWSALYLKPGFRCSANILFGVPYKNAKFVLLPFLFYGSDFGSDLRKVTATNTQLDRLSAWVQPLYG